MAARSTHFLELCAGVGGLGLGVQLAEPGSRCIAYVEREAYAAAILAARMAAGDLDDAPIWSELATFDAGAWRGAVDCVVSGDPCQPNSISGRFAGADDERFLIEQVLRVFAESGASRLFRENVTGNADGQLAALVPPLEAMGCRVAAGIFTAAEVGAGHTRARLFLMADAHGPRGTAWLPTPPRRTGGQAEIALDGGSGLVAFAPGPTDPRWATILAVSPGLEPAVRRMGNGVAHRVDRLRAIGNGAVPLVAAYAWRTLGALLAETGGAGQLVLTERRAA